MLLPVWKLFDNSSSNEAGKPHAIRSVLLLSHCIHK